MSGVHGSPNLSFDISFLGTGMERSFTTTPRRPCSQNVFLQSVEMKALWRQTRRELGGGGGGREGREEGEEIRPTGEEEKRSSQLEKENFLPCRRHPSPSDRRRRRRGYSSVTRTALRGNPPPSSSRFHQQKKIHAQTPIVSYFC